MVLKLARRALVGPCASAAQDPPEGAFRSGLLAALQAGKMLLAKSPSSECLAAASALLMALA